MNTSWTRSTNLGFPDAICMSFDADGLSLGRTPTPGFLHPFASPALTVGEVWARPEATGDVSRRLYGRRIEVAGHTYAATATATAVEVEDQYPGLFASFLLAALGALVLVALGGATLARKSLAPVERSITRMRRFVADASHELRTPAAVLRTRAEVALSIRKQPVFLDDLLVQASELARTLAASRGVALELGDFDEAPVDADPELMRQLFLILLENAVKYTPAWGLVRVGVTANDTTCRLTVQDTGPGIDPDILPHVFERFYRADPARSRAGGTGLGLAIARSIADAHGADISLTSAVNEGTTVRVSMRRRAMATLTALALGATLAGAWPKGAAAQEALTLEQALSRAHVVSPTLGAASADSAAAAAGLEMARAFPNPSLVLGYSRSVPNYHAEAEFPLDYPWIRGPRIRAARALAGAGGLGVDVARAGVRYRVESAYASAAGATALQVLSSQALSDGAETLRIAAAREASGDAAELDVALARIALGEIRSTMLSDSLAALDAVLSLQSLLGMPQDRVLVIPRDSLSDLDPPPADGAGTPLRLRAADSVVASRRAGLTLARRSRFPAPALRLGFERGDPSGSEPGTLPTVGITIPLPIFDRGGAQVASAKAALARARAERLAQARDVASALPAARRRWETALARIAVDRDAVEDARRVAALTQAAYREGAYPLASVLEAQRSARDTLRRLVEDLMAGREAAAAYRLAITAGGSTP